MIAHRAGPLDRTARAVTVVPPVRANPGLGHPTSALV